MLTDLKEKIGLMKDYGLFHCVAEAIAPAFKKFYYYVEYRSAFPKSSLAEIGKGFPGITRVPRTEGGRDLYDFIDEADVLIFPDVMDGDLETSERKRGKLVWGPGHASRLEQDRWYFRQLQVELGMPAPKTLLVHGLDELEDALRSLENVYVKVATWRGDIETFHHIDWNLTEERLVHWRYVLGPKGLTMNFLVEYPVAPDGVEVGVDTYVVDGEYPPVIAYGYEKKGRAYLGTWRRKEDLPRPLAWSNEKLGPTFKTFGMRGFYSNEIRIGQERVPYIIDPCVRAGSPPTEAVSSLYDNFAEMIYNGAAGELIEPKPKAKYFGLARVCTPQAATGPWTTVEIPDEAKPFVKLRNATYQNRRYRVAGGSGVDTIGSIIGFGDTVDEVKAQIRKIAPLVRANDIEIYTDELDDLSATIEKGRHFGIDF